MRRLVLAPLAVLVLVVAACGQEEASVLDRALENPVQSAQVSMRLSAVRASGELGSVEVSGPMRSNGPKRLESFDWRVRLHLPNERPP